MVAAVTLEVIEPHLEIARNEIITGSHTGTTFNFVWRLARVTHGAAAASARHRQDICGDVEAVVDRSIFVREVSYR